MGIEISFSREERAGTRTIRISSGFETQATSVSGISAWPSCTPEHKQTLAQALASDGRSWDFRGGGITFDECSATYQYPSGGLQYHLRYILLHEVAHLFQACLAGNLRSVPSWYTEGVADLLSHHVWEAGRKRLTLNVLDKATDINWLDRAVRRFGEKRFTAADIARGTLRDRDVGFLLVAYFMTDVERSLKFRIYRDELFRLNLYNVPGAFGCA